jgi:hypothetical protein
LSRTVFNEIHETYVTSLHAADSNFNHSYQRPSARDLLKHKFVRLAKKTNYLTELIERHERWKADGGERIEEEARDAGDD